MSHIESYEHLAQPPVEYSHARQVSLVIALGASLLLSVCKVNIPGITNDNQPAVGGDKARNLNDNPGFRATSIEIMGDDKGLVGSGSLIKIGSQYKLATVEHVARALDGEGVNREPEIPTIGAKKSENPSFNVPGLGVFNLSKTAKYSGNQQRNRYGILDRFTTFALPADEQKTIAKAVKQGTLNIPEKIPFKATLGDEFFMPLADSGKEVPFIYVDRDVDNGQPRMIPLFMLDNGLDYKRGVANFKHLIAAIKADLDRKQNQYTPEIPAEYAMEELQTKLLKSFADSPGKAALELACDGDSGSPFLDKTGNVVGTLSSGYKFYAVGYKDDMAAYHIARLDTSGTPDMARTCLSEIRIAT